MCASMWRRTPASPDSSVEKHLKEALGFAPKGDVFPPGGLPRQEGKAKRVFFEGGADLR